MVLKTSDLAVFGGVCRRDKGEGKRKTGERSSRPSLHWIDCCEKENAFKPVSSCEVIFELHSFPSEKTSRLASRTLLELRHDALRCCGRAVVVFGKKEEESKTQMLTSKTFMEGQGPAKILWFGAKRYVLWRVGPTVTCGCCKPCLCLDDRDLALGSLLSSFLLHTLYYARLIKRS